MNEKTIAISREDIERDQKDKSDENRYAMQYATCNDVTVCRMKSMLISNERIIEQLVREKKELQERLVEAEMKRPIQMNVSLQKNEICEMFVSPHLTDRIAEMVQEESEERKEAEKKVGEENEKQNVTEKDIVNFNRLHPHPMACETPWEFRCRLEAEHTTKHDSMFPYLFRGWKPESEAAK